MKTLLHPSSQRGQADYGWLKTRYSFSFADWYDPKRIHFGMLRVLNDDTVEGGGGFGAHPHDNMEIVTIPTEGALEHKDSMGNTSVIRKNEVQIMSAGTGIYHSEFNHEKEIPTKLFQIWVFPKLRNIQPRYDQKLFDPSGRIDRWQTLVAPERDAETMWINQDAWFSLATLGAGKTLEYAPHLPGNGMYLFVVGGSAEAAGVPLAARDALGIWETERAAVTAKVTAELLLIEIPMT